jgi:hypothetical protein
MFTFEGMKGLMKKMILCVLLLPTAAAGATMRGASDDWCITEIRICGNKRTRDFTILRELPFRKGDVIRAETLAERLITATEHLNNTSLFNYVSVDYEPDSTGNPPPPDCRACVVTVRVEERWYYWPQVNLKLEDRNLSSWLNERNFNRITIGWGMRVYNVFGMRHKITASHYFGFEKGFRLAYSNIALDRKRTQMLGLSVSALFNRTLNVKTEDDRVVYVKDPRRFLDRTLETTLSYAYRPGIRNTHSLDAGYRRVQLADTVLQINKDYWGTDRLTNHALMLSYKYNYEHRDYIAYPTKGYFAATEMTAILADRMHFFYGELNLRLQYYGEFFPRWFWSSRLNTGVTFKNKRAGLYDRHVGYEEKNLIGYDYYVIDGQHHAILNNDVRFLVMPKRIFNLFASEKGKRFTKIHFSLYAKLSYDAGYVHNVYGRSSGSLANTFLWGSGIGLDLVTYYDIILSCNYAMNKMGEGGFYFGIKAPVF